MQSGNIVLVEPQKAESINVIFQITMPSGAIFTSPDSASTLANEIFPNDSSED